MRNPNGYGSVIKLSGNRRKPYQVRVNTHLDNRGYPVFDVLGYFEDRQTALIALAEYNKTPYSVTDSKMTFKEVYLRWYERKYRGVKKLSKSSEYCTEAAFKQCEQLHERVFKELRTQDLQETLNSCRLSFSMNSHIKNLLGQMYKYAMEMDIVEKNYAGFVQNAKADDGRHGIPFTAAEIEQLWQHIDKPLVDSILIYIYSGWRVSELLTMPISSIDVENRTMQGGLKNKFSRNRIVPIHSKIVPLVKRYYNPLYPHLFHHLGAPLDTRAKYITFFNEALKSANIKTPHKPHDCRHTFATLMAQHGADPVATKKILGHATKDITTDLYTHADIDFLRKNIELIP